MRALWVQMIDLDLFSDFLRDVTMATNFVTKSHTDTNTDTLLIIQATNVCGTEVKYRYANVRVNGANDASTSC